MKRNWTFWLGLVLALSGAGIMWQGSLLGERTTSIASVMGIIGIVLIATGRKKK